MLLAVLTAILAAVLFAVLNKLLTTVLLSSANCGADRSAYSDANRGTTAFLLAMLMFELTAVLTRKQQ